jgi:MFS family permease
MNDSTAIPNARARYNRFLLLVAGLGGLLFGVDVGIISGALPYLEATFKDAGHILTAGQSSFIVAAVLLGGVFSTLFAGMLADCFGRKKMLVFSGVLFVISVPVIALSSSYEALIFGRLLQGISGGLIGVVVPLYLAECLAAADRGKGTGIFQWLLTLGIVAAAVIGFYFSGRVEEVAKLGDAEKLFAFKDTAWRGIFWVSLPPGILFVIGGCLVSCVAAAKQRPRCARCGAHDPKRRRKSSCRKWPRSPLPKNLRRTLPASIPRRCCSANIFYRSCSPASFSPATRPPASIPSLVTTLQF